MKKYFNNKMSKLNLHIIAEGIYLKNHMIKFEPESLSLLLYDLKGILLDKIFIYHLIYDICIINNNFILTRNYYNILTKIKINNNTLEKEDILFFKDLRIYDIIYVKESKLLIISFKTFIGIWDIDSLFKNPIQIINSKSSHLLNFNLNLFISYEHKNISIYQKTNNIKLYQLPSILTLDNKSNYYIDLIKLDNRTLMISKGNEIYLTDILKMKTKKNIFIKGEYEIKYVYKKDKDIFLNYGNDLYTIRYNKFNLEIINKIKKPKFILESKIKRYLLERTFSIALVNDNIINDKEPIKFFSYKHEVTIGNSIQIQESQNSQSSSFILELISSLENENLLKEIMKIDKDKNEKRNDKRKDTFKKYEIKNEKIKNNPNKFKKKFR